MVLNKLFAKLVKLFVVSVYPFLPHHVATIPATIGPENDVPSIVLKLFVLVYGVLAVQSYAGTRIFSPGATVVQPDP